MATAGIARLNVLSRAALAASLALLPLAAEARWQPPVAPEEAKQINERNEGPARVRIGLRLTPFKKIVNRQKSGETETRYLPVEPLRHTLRARLNKVNHFFVGEWHIETRPLNWVKKTGRYDVRLTIYRRYGAFGQLEENVGHVDLSGVLEQQEEKLFVLVGVARKRLRDKFQNPYMDVVAGFSPTPEAKSNVSLAPTGRIPEPPVTSSEALIRGRF